MLSPAKFLPPSVYSSTCSIPTAEENYLTYANLGKKRYLALHLGNSSFTASKAYKVLVGHRPVHPMFSFGFYTGID
jgi:alpha-glucosidase (family GH31 glycosyl hydrolase)